MRVLIVTPWFPCLKLPGAGVFNLRDAEMLSQSHDVSILHLISPDHMSPEEPERGEVAPGISVRRIAFSSGRVDLIRKAAREIAAAAQDFDLVHSMAFPALRPVAMARTGLPWVHTEHWSGLVNKPTTLRARIGSIVLRRWLRAPDVAVAVGQGLAQVMNPYRSEPTDVIGNKVLLAPSSALPEPPPRDADAPLRLIGVGNLIPHKGPLETVDAVAELIRRGTNATLEWAGVGALDTAVRERAEDHGVADRVKLLGHLDPDELSAAFLRAHMFVLPTAGETFGVAIAEALGHGLPVVATGRGGHEGFLPAQASRLITDRTGAALASAIEDLARDPSRCAPQQIAEYARETFSEATRSARYDEVYDRAVQKRATSRR